MPDKPISDRDLYRFDILYGAPEIAKAASVKQLLAKEASDAAYADQGRIYAIHTPGATWVSTAHFLEMQSKLPAKQRERIAEKLAAAARQHRIEGPIAELRAKHASLQSLNQEALGNETFGYLVKDASGNVVDRKLRLLNAAEVKKASEWLVQHRDEFAYPDRMTIAQRVIRRSEKLACSLDPEIADTLDRIAGYGETTLSRIKRAVEARVSLIRPRSEDAAGAVKDLFRALRDRPRTLRDRPAMIKLSEILDKVDRQMELIDRYGKEIDRPEDVFFAVTEKVAAAFVNDHVQTQSGSIYVKRDLEQVSLDSLAAALGEKVAAAITLDNVLVDADRAAEILPTIPTAQARLFDAIAKSAGVEPVMTETSESPRLTTSDLIRLANQNGPNAKPKK